MNSLDGMEEEDMDPIEQPEEVVEVEEVMDITDVVTSAIDSDFMSEFNADVDVLMGRLQIRAADVELATRKLAADSVLLLMANMDPTISKIDVELMELAVQSQAKAIVAASSTFVVSGVRSAVNAFMMKLLDRGIRIALTM